MPTQPQDWTQLWTALAALAASATALVTIIYTYFTLKLVRAQAEPKVIVYVRHDFDRPSILLIVIENIGRDIALDVAFTASRPIPSRAFGIERSQAQPAPSMSDGPLMSGIPSLGPGDIRIITWGQYGGLSVALGTKPIQLTYTYRHGTRKFTGEAQLEVDSYVNTDASERPLLVATKALKDIASSAAVIAQDVKDRRHISRPPDDDAA
jgi:hypothetical protein